MGLEQLSMDSKLIAGPAQEGLVIRTWEPDSPCVVLGRSNHAEKELRMDNCRKDEIPVARRLGGGGAVYLDQGMLVVTMAEPAASLLPPGYWFERFNNRIVNWLKMADIRGVEQKGHSDLCIGDRKILGCCLHFPKGWAFYQASLLVCCDLGPMDRYLSHPSKEPEYRAGRPHLEFMTTLEDRGHELKPSQLRELIGYEFRDDLCAVNQ